MQVCCFCQNQCHPSDHRWELTSGVDPSASHICQMGVAVFEHTEEGTIAWCARCWTIRADTMEERSVVAERRDAVAKGRRWI